MSKDMPHLRHDGSLMKLSSGQRTSLHPEIFGREEGGLVQPFEARWMGNHDVPFQNSERIVTSERSGYGGVQEYLVEHDAGAFWVDVILPYIIYMYTKYMCTGGRSRMHVSNNIIYNLRRAYIYVGINSIVKLSVNILVYVKSARLARSIRA